jgi:glycosyltransferase involved in cell wall biosynthesis
VLSEVKGCRIFIVDEPKNLPALPSELRCIDSLQIGLGWFPENPGGLDRFFYNLIRHLPAEGVRVSGLVLGTVEGEIVPDCAIHSYARLSDSLASRLCSARRAVKQAISKKRPDIICSHFAAFTLPALDLVRRHPFVVHFHGPWAQELVAERTNMDFVTKVKQRIAAVAERSVYRQASRAIVLSNAFGKLLSHTYGVPEDIIRVIPGGVDFERFHLSISKEEARESLKIPINRPVVLCVRRLARRMGLDALIAAMAEVSSKFPDVLLVIVGKGPIYDRLAQQIASMSLSDNVCLRGFVEDSLLPIFYRAADFTIVPSTSLEGFGLVTLESLAAGTPVLVTPVGGLPEAVAPLALEFLMSSSAPAALAEGISTALSGERQFPDSSTCSDYARTRFSWASVSRQTRAIYDEVCE